MNNPQEKVETIQLTAEKLLLELVGLPGDIAVLALVEASTRVLRTLQKCEKTEALNALVEVIEQVKAVQ